MSTSRDADHERRKAAAWVWYQRGANASHVQQSGHLLKLRRRRSRRGETDQDRLLGFRLHQPSRFKREFAASRYVDYSRESSPYPTSDVRKHLDHSYSSPASIPAMAPPAQFSDHRVHGLQLPTAVASINYCQSSPAVNPISQPAPLSHCTHCSDCISPSPRRRSDQGPSPPTPDRWIDRLLGLSSRKSFSSLHSPLHQSSSPSSFCSSYHDSDHDSISLFGSFCGLLDGDEEDVAAATIYPSSLLDSFELRTILKKLRFDADEFGEQILSSSLLAEQEEAGNQNPNLSPAPSPSKHSLYDLLGWSERGLDMNGVKSCVGEEEDQSREHHFSAAGSPEMFNSSSCRSAQAAMPELRHRHRHRRPSILMLHLPHTISNAFHNIHIPQLPHSLSTAIHHLPHSFSTALHHISHLTHSISSAYRSHRHDFSHRHSFTDTVNPQSPTINESIFTAHPMDSAASNPQSNTHTHHRNRLPTHLRHLFSFKSPSKFTPAVNGSEINRAADICSSDITGREKSAADSHSRDSTAPANGLVLSHAKTSPLDVDRHLHRGDEYMLIYSCSAEKHINHAVLHQHFHHHYHHHHYIF